MKKIFSLIITTLVLTGFIFVVTGCDKSKKVEKKDNTVEISYEFGKGTFKLSVPKDDEGKAKYEFTTEKPKEISTYSSFYLVTDKSVFGFSTGGLSYNTSKDYKAKYGDTKATFDGYLEFIEDEDLFNKSYLPGLKKLKINNRKAIRYYNRVGSPNNYKYYGFFYLVGADDIYKGSKVQMTVNYKTDDKPTESKKLDSETLSILNSLKIVSNTK